MGATDESDTVVYDLSTTLEWRDLVGIHFDTNLLFIGTMCISY